VTFASVLYFADTRMKTKDNSFAGFPACWNMVAVVIFALQPPFWVSLTLVVVLAATMFTPLKFIHPVRTARWRRVSLPVAVAWTVFAGWAAAVDFAPEGWASWGLLVTSAYLLGAGVAQQIFPGKRGHTRV
jgi:phosphatidylcholine synthase